MVAARHVCEPEAFGRRRGSHQLRATGPTLPLLRTIGELLNDGQSESEWEHDRAH
jgi:hypothetical protein